MVSGFHPDFPQKGEEIVSKDVGCPKNSVVGEFVFEGKQPGSHDIVAGFLGCA
jgi:hypothetical protein